MATVEVLERLLELEPEPSRSVSEFRRGWDSGYHHGLRTALELAKSEAFE